MMSLLFSDNITAFNVNKNQIQNDVPVAIGINADEPVTFLNFLLKGSNSYTLFI